MIAVVTGGSASGKSAFAESLALSLPGPHVYVATMRNSHDEETEARIARHRAMREGKGFVTVELADLQALGAAPERAPFDVSSSRAKVSLLLGLDLTPPYSEPHETASVPNVVHNVAGAGDNLACRTALLEDLGNLVANGLQGELEGVLACENVVIVANEVGCDGVCYDAFTMEYIAEIGSLARELAARADLVVEVVAGVPCVVKGELPCIC